MQDRPRECFPDSRDNIYYRDFASRHYMRTNKNKLLTHSDVHCKRILELSKKITVEKNYFPKSAPFYFPLSSYLINYTQIVIKT